MFREENSQKGQVGFIHNEPCKDGGGSRRGQLEEGKWGKTWGGGDQTALLLQQQLKRQNMSDEGNSDMRPWEEQL